MAVFERESVFCAGSKDTWGKGVGEIRDVVVGGGGEVDEAREVSGDGVEGGDVIEPELAECGLQHFDARRGIDG